jgi:hypothetical protein
MNLNLYAKKVHEANHKWWVDLETGKPIKRNKSELVMLIVSELAECLEGERKNLMDDKLPHRKMAEVEMADTVIRILDFAGGFGYSLTYETIIKEDLHLPTNKAECLLDITKVLLDGTEGDHGWVSSGLSAVVWGCDAYCLNHGYDLWGAVEEKLEYNSIRADHQIEARKAANGKKW